MLPDLAIELILAFACKVDELNPLEMVVDRLAAARTSLLFTWNIAAKILFLNNGYEIFYGFVEAESYLKTNYLRARKSSCLSRKIALSDYFLTPVELDNIVPSCIYKNKHRQISKTYDKGAIIRAALDKFGGEMQFFARKQHVFFKPPSSDTTELRKMRHRELKVALENAGLRMRKDSLLCHQYVQHGISTVPSILQVMIEMDFYYKYTTYKSHYKQIRSAMQRAGWNRLEISQITKVNVMYHFVTENPICPEYCPATIAREWYS